MVLVNYIKTGGNLVNIVSSFLLMNYSNSKQ